MNEKRSKSALITLVLISQVVAIGCNNFPKLNSSKAKAASDQTTLMSRAKTDVADLDRKFMSARSHEQQGDIQTAVQMYQNIVAEKPDFAAAHHRLAITLDQAGVPQQSKKHYEKALSLQPSADLYCDFGYSCFLKDDYQHAESNFRRALELNSSHQRSHNNLAQMLAKTGRSSIATQHYLAAGCSTEQAQWNMNVATSNLPYESPNQTPRGTAPNRTMNPMPIPVPPIQQIQLANKVNSTPLPANAITRPTATMKTAPMPAVTRPTATPPITAMPMATRPVAKTPPITRPAVSDSRMASREKAINVVAQPAAQIAELPKVAMPQPQPASSLQTIELKSVPNSSVDDEESHRPIVSIAPAIRIPRTQETQVQPTAYHNQGIKSSFENSANVRTAVQPVRYSFGDTK